MTSMSMIMASIKALHPVAFITDLLIVASAIDVSVVASSFETLIFNTKNPAAGLEAPTPISVTLPLLKRVPYIYYLLCF